MWNEKWVNWLDSVPYCPKCGKPIQQDEILGTK